MPDLSELHGSAQTETPNYTPQQRELAQKYVSFASEILNKNHVV